MSTVLTQSVAAATVRRVSTPRAGQPMAQVARRLHPVTFTDSGAAARQASSNDARLAPDDRVKLERLIAHSRIDPLHEGVSLEGNR